MPPLGVDFASAANALVAAHLAPGAPQGEIQTLDEHGSLWPATWADTRAPGRIWLCPEDRFAEMRCYGARI